MSTPTAANPTALYTPNQAITSSIGAMVIECLTIVASLYLLRPLYKQGLTKLRVRFLFGMVFSDFLLGVIGAIPNAAYLAGNRLKQGTGTCNAVGFILTSVLFTQHMWTMTLAVATYALLKHPMSRFTYLMNKYWIVIPLGIWGVSIFHSGLWWRFIGFSPSSAGSLCYYGHGSYKYDRTLVQFIPRASVFVVVVVLYSQLYRFLRRPDTIQLSSMHGTDSDYGAQTNDRILQAVKSKVKMAAAGVVPSDSNWQRDKDDIPPWEKLHINNVGGLLLPKDLQTVDPRMITTTTTLPATRSAEELADRSRKNTESTLVDQPWSEDKREMRSLSVEDIEARGMSTTMDSNRPPDIEISLDFIPEGQVIHSRRGSAHPQTNHLSGRTEGTGDLTPASHSAPTSIFNLPYNGFSRRVSIDQEAILQDERRLKTTISVPSDSTRKGSSDSDDDDDEDMVEDLDTSIDLEDGSRRGSGSLSYKPRHRRHSGDPGQTLQEFFAQHQTPIDELEARARQHGDNDTSPLGPQDSAASYFNRQASLLMLYFPLAYLIVFAVSLVRLVYDMITNEPNAILTIVSLWFVLSVGLVDAAVYVSSIRRGFYMVKSNKTNLRLLSPEHRRAGQNGP